MLFYNNTIHKYIHTYIQKMYFLLLFYWNLIEDSKKKNIIKSKFNFILEFLKIFPI